MANRDEAQDAEPQVANDHRGELITYDQVATELAVPKGTLYFWVATGQIPHLRLGPRTVRFRRGDLEAWVQKRVVTPTDKRNAGGWG